MARYPVPPPDFECTYQKSCPHMDGLSAKWAYTCYQEQFKLESKYWRLHDESREEAKKFMKRIQDLEAENAQLKSKLKISHQRQFKANRKSDQKKETKNSKEEKPPNKRGAPPGHPGWFRRKPDRIDKEINVNAPEACPHCNNTDLTYLDEKRDHIQEDIVLNPKTEIIRFTHAQAWCPKCRRKVIMQEKNELLNCPIGPRAKSVAVFLRHGLGLTYRKTKELMSTFFALSYVPASAVGFDRQAQRKGQPLYEDLLEKLRSLPVAYADETHWREDGKSAYVWYGGNKDLSVFHIEKSRAASVAKKLFGENFDGVLVADAYAAYNAINPKARQSCIAHLLRKSKEIHNEILSTEKKYQDGDALIFCENMSQFFSNICVLAHSIEKREMRQPSLHTIRDQLYDELNEYCKLELKNKNAEGFRLRLLDPKREYNRLFVFLNYPDVEPTNNHSEQSLRWLVIFRKLCFGTRSQEGSKSLSVLASLVDTARRQGRHPLDFLEVLFASDARTAHRALYGAGIPS